MTGSLKRHPSEEAEETPLSKRQESHPPDSSNSETSNTGASDPGSSDPPQSSDTVPAVDVPTQPPTISITAPIEPEDTPHSVASENSSVPPDLAPTPPNTPPKADPNEVVDPPTVLSPPNKLEGVSAPLLAGKVSSEVKVNGTENSILNSGFSLTGSTNFFSAGEWALDRNEMLNLVYFNIKNFTINSIPY